MTMICMSQVTVNVQECICVCVCVAEEDACKLESPDMAQGGFPLIDTYKAENFLFDLMTLSLQGMLFCLFNTMEIFF